MMKQTVLLTGVSGFLGSHTAIQLLEKGYRVLGTLRNMDRAESMREIIAKYTQHIGALDFAQAELLDERVWIELMKGITYVQHIASPFPKVLPKDEKELLVPAKKGTLNILQAAATQGVKRVVVTSSTGAIVYGKPKGQRAGIYSEEDWTDETYKEDVTAYFRSKTVAEKAAWDYINSTKGELELAVVCPGAILGPLLEQDFSASANIVIKTMDGSSPAIPKIGFDMVDVRSVADLLIRAMELPEAAGERFIGSAGYLSFKEVANSLRQAYPDRKIPQSVLPNFAVRLFARIDPTLKPILNDLGIERRVDNRKAKEVLGWNPKTPKEAVLACAESVIKLGIV
ncbi:MAG: aldehyde reductase [Bacteroidota bacterium]